MKGMEQPASIEKIEQKPKAKSKILRANKNLPEFWAISDEDQEKLVRVIR